MGLDTLDHGSNLGNQA